MKYKILKGSPLFDKIQRVRVRMMEAHDLARETAIKMGAKSWRGKNSQDVGGLSAFKFKKLPTNIVWRKAYGSRVDDEVFPKAVSSNKQLLDNIAALPTVSRREIDRLVGFKPQFIGETNYFRFGCAWVVGSAVILIDVGTRIKYKPRAGMIEITESEYLGLSAGIEKKKEKQKATA